MNVTSKDNAVLFNVKVVPNSSRTQVAGILGDALKIKVAQPPEAGRANRAVIELLADALNIPPANIAIVAGHTQPRKTVRIQGVSAEALQRWINDQ